MYSWGNRHMYHVGGDNCKLTGMKTMGHMTTSSCWTPDAMPWFRAFPLIILHTISD